MNGRTKYTFNNMLYGFISKCLSLLLPFVIRTIIIYKLGSDYVGVGSLFTSILQVLSVTELGFASAVSYAMYEPIAKGQTQNVIEFVTLLRTIYKIVGVTILLIGLCVLPFLPKLIKGDIPSDINVYYIFAIYLSNTSISYLFCGYKNSVLSANQRYDIISKIEISVSVVRGIIQIAALLLFSNYYLYTILIPCFTLASNVLVNKYSEIMFPELKPLKRWTLRGFKTLSKQFGGIALGRISLMCRNSFDSIIISSLFGLLTVTIYSNYFLIISSINSVMSVIFTSMAASVGNSLAIESMEKNESDHIKFDFYYGVIVSFCSICLFSLLQPFMKIWVGDSLIFPWKTMALFCLYYYTNQLSQIRSIYSEAAGLWWNFKYLTIIEMSANIILNIYLGLRIGVNGIIISTIITAFGGSFVGCSYITYRTLFKKSSKPYFVNNFFYFFVTILGCIFIYFINLAINGDNIKMFVFRIVITLLFASFYLIGIYMAVKKYRRYLLDLPIKKLLNL